MSHFRRHAINKARQASFCDGKETLEIPKGPDPGFARCVGTRLMGSNNSHRCVFNGGLYEVTSLCPLQLQGEDGASFEMTPEHVSKHLRLAHAVTYPSIQGRTLQGVVGVYDLDSKHFTTRHLYIGISRATAGALISVY